MKEELEKAIHDLDFAANELQQVANKCSNVEFIILLPLLQKARELRRDVNNLLNAVREA